MVYRLIIYEFYIGVFFFVLLKFYVKLINIYL